MEYFKYLTQAGDVYIWLARRDSYGQTNLSFTSQNNSSHQGLSHYSTFPLSICLPSVDCLIASTINLLHQHSPDMSYKVYMVDFLGRSGGIFVETEDKGLESGYLYQVIGDIQNGTIHSHKEARRPVSASKFIGTVSISNYPEIRTICNNITPEPSIDPYGASRRCQEWTKQVIDVLFSRGILERPNPMAIPLRQWKRIDQCESPLSANLTFDWPGVRQGGLAAL